MVLSLVNLSLLSIRDFVEHGALPYLDELPRRWRRTILDFVLMHGTVLKPTCLDSLTSADFLYDFSSLCTWSGRVIDGQFLDRVSHTLDGSSAIRLSQLALNLYASDGDSRTNSCVHNFPNAIKLIAECRTLSSLHLRFLSSGDNNAADVVRLNSVVRFLPTSDASPSTWKPLGDGGFLNSITAYRPCLSILENLAEFSLITADLNARSTPPILTSHQPLLRFKNLVSLRLVGGTAYFDAWFHFMDLVYDTLQHLHVENVEFHWGRQRNACVLPFCLPRLESLSAHGLLSYCDSTLVKNLKRSTRLRFISLTLSGLENGDNFISLSEISALREVRLNFRHGLFAERGADDVVGEMVKLFGDKITSFVFNGARSPSLSSACEHLVDGCENLVAFRLDTTAYFIDTDQSYLAPLFTDKGRALKLRDLELHGQLAPFVLTSLFGNCLNLDSLTIRDCPELSDVFLYQWAVHGARPHTIKLVNCPNVTDVGLGFVLITCGLRLTHFRFTSEEHSKITQRTLDTIAEFCRNIEWFCVPKAVCDDKTLAKIREKAFKDPVNAVLI